MKKLTHVNQICPPRPVRAHGNAGSVKTHHIDMRRIYDRLPKLGRQCKLLHIHIFLHAVFNLLKLSPILRKFLFWFSIYSCGKHCEKRRKCLKQAVSPFLTMFPTLYVTYFSFQMLFKMLSVISLNVDQSKILSSGNELNN